MATMGCGISHKNKKKINIQINAATTKQEQHGNKMTYPQILFQSTVKITQKSLA
jgi:hypothetical protein